QDVGAPLVPLIGQIEPADERPGINDVFYLHSLRERKGPTVPRTSRGMAQPAWRNQSLPSPLPDSGRAGPAPKNSPSGEPRPFAVLDRASQGFLASQFSCNTQGNTAFRSVSIAHYSFRHMDDYEHGAESEVRRVALEHPAAADRGEKLPITYRDFAANRDQARAPLDLPAFEGAVIHVHHLRLRRNGPAIFGIVDDEIGIRADLDGAFAREQTERLRRVRARDIHERVQIELSGFDPMS